MISSHGSEPEHSGWPRHARPGRRNFNFNFKLKLTSAPPGPAEPLRLARPTVRVRRRRGVSVTVITDDKDHDHHIIEFHWHAFQNSSDPPQPSSCQYRDLGTSCAYLYCHFLYGSRFLPLLFGFTKKCVNRSPGGGGIGSLGQHRPAPVPPLSASLACWWSCPLSRWPCPLSWRHPASCSHLSYSRWRCRPSPRQH